MMLQPTTRFSAEEFLAWDATQSERYQLVWGEASAMAGASVAHGTIVANLTVLLRPGLRGGPCRFFTTDVKLAIGTDARRITYPDAFVTCDARDRGERLIQRFPKLIVEVLFPSTAADDRGEKFAAYRTIATLEEYVLVDGTRPHVEAYRRTERGTWELVHDADAGSIDLASLDGMMITFDDLYADVDLTTQSDRS